MNRLKVDKERGPAQFNYGKAFENGYENKEILEREFWLIVKEILAGSFVISSGRQYAQFCDMVIAASLLEEMGIEVDWEVLNSPEVEEYIANWELPDPGLHTQKPKHTEDQVKGVYLFWWDRLKDAFKWRHDLSFQLPGNKMEVAEQFRKRGVRLYATSSSYEEEISATNDALDQLRGDSALKRASSHDLALLSLKHHLKVMLHWLANKPPRKTEEEKPYQTLWRDGMLEALQTPEDQRSIYDHILLRHIQALDFVTSLSPEELHEYPELAEIHELYTMALDAYNHVYHKTPAQFIHRPNNIEAMVTMPTRLPLLQAFGSVGLQAASD